MKLSDAIERGIPMTVGAARGKLFRERCGAVQACALGTAMLGAGILTADEVLRQGRLNLAPGVGLLGVLDDKIDQDLGEYLMHPVTQNYVAVRGVVASLNDSYRWSREKIILWLRERGS